MAATRAFVEIEPGVAKTSDSIWDRFPKPGWISQGNPCAAREILRLAERVKTLEVIAGEAEAALLMQRCGCSGGFICSRCKALKALRPDFVPPKECSAFIHHLSAACQGGNFGNRLVCKAHFAVTNGPDWTEEQAQAVEMVMAAKSTPPRPWTSEGLDDLHWLGPAGVCMICGGPWPCEERRLRDTILREREKAKGAEPSLENAFCNAAILALYRVLTGKEG